MNKLQKEIQSREIELNILMDKLMNPMPFWKRWALWQRIERQYGYIKELRGGGYDI